MNNYCDVAVALARAKKIMVLTGAGISTASGIPDFRSRSGLYNLDIEIESVLSERYFNDHPETFWRKFKSIFQIDKVRDFEPNYGHLFLRHLESDGKDTVIFTQNIDGLHKKAGSSKVFELHGSYETAHCIECKQKYTLLHLLNNEIPRCLRDNAILKPDVVLFGGPVKHLQAAYETASSIDLFLTIGSSLSVYPAREIPTYVANAKEIVKILINMDKTNLDPLFDYVFHRNINATLHEISNLYQHKK